jgi:hypothetical protein
MGARAIAAALAAVALLAGCSGETGAGSQESTPKSAPPPSVSPGEQFLASVRGTPSWLEKAPPDEEILEFPPRWCASAAEGHGVPWMLQGGGRWDLYPNGWEWGTKVEDAREIVIKAITAYCPEHRAAAIQSLAAGSTAY